MIYKGLELHNIHEVVEIEGCEIFSRYPQALNDTIKHNVAYQFTSVEIRFVPKEEVKITIGSKFSFIQPKCMIYYGDFANPEEILIDNEKTITINPLAKFGVLVKQQAKMLAKETDFSIDVIRIVLHGEGFYIKDICGAYRLPTKEEKPAKKLLSYGTSITQGIGATSPDMSYPFILGRLLHMDAYNYALSGKCLCESEVIKYMAKTNTYEIITIEASVNMISLGYHEDEYYKRMKELLCILKRYQPNARIYCIDIFPYWADMGFRNPEQQMVSSSQKYKMKLKQLTNELDDFNIQYINASECISIHNLSSDLIHPANHGMVEIAYHLASILQQKSVLNSSWVKDK